MFHNYGKEYKGKVVWRCCSYLVTKSQKSCRRAFRKQTAISRRPEAFSAEACICPSPDTLRYRVVGGEGRQQGRWSAASYCMPGGTTKQFYYAFNFSIPHVNLNLIRAAIHHHLGYVSVPLFDQQSPHMVDNLKFASEGEPISVRSIERIKAACIL